MIAEFHRASRELPGPRDWILDIFGSFVREFGGWIAVADLLVLLETIGVPASSGRSALSRMKRRGELEAISLGTHRGYSLTQTAEQWFQDGTPRIMKGPPETSKDSWLLASFTVPEENRSVRYRIRAGLHELGFGHVSGGLMIAPAYFADEVRSSISRAEYTDYVELWQAEHLGFGDLRELVARAWNLDEILQVYAEYVEVAEKLASQPPPFSDEEAFVHYLVNLNAWRDLPFLDPGLPLAHLPEGWPSEDARAMFGELAGELRPAAWRHFTQLLNH